MINNLIVDVTHLQELHPSRSSGIDAKVKKELLSMPRFLSYRDRQNGGGDLAGSSCGDLGVRRSDYRSHASRPPGTCPSILVSASSVVDPGLGVLAISTCPKPWDSVAFGPVTFGDKLK